ncbi:MAG: transporter [Burkholderiales bacterium]|nr:transporter [Burkholderiales bacterium]
MRSRVTAFGAGMLVARCALAAPGDELTLGGGFHHSSGDYGTSTTTQITTLAATARYDSGFWVYRATVPYLRVRGDTSVIPGTGRVRGSANERRTASGLGDVVVSGTYTAFYDRASTLGFDLTGKVKLATADEDEGLGTGEHDFIFLADFYRTFHRVTGFGGIGYHVLGDSPGFPLDNAWSATVGASYKINERDNAGVSLDGRQRVAPGLSPQRELVAFFIRKLDRAWKAQAYGLVGLADGSPDWGAGLSLARPF